MYNNYEGKLQGGAIAEYSWLHSTQTPPLCSAKEVQTLLGQKLQCFLTMTAQPKVDAMFCPFLYPVHPSCSDHPNRRSDYEILSVALRKHGLLPEFL